MALSESSRSGSTVFPNKKVKMSLNHSHDIGIQESHNSVHLKV